MGRLIVLAGASVLIGCQGGKDVSDSGHPGDTGTPEAAVEIAPVVEVDGGASSDPRWYWFWGARFVPSLTGSGAAVLVEGMVSDDTRADFPSVILELEFPLTSDMSVRDAEIVSPPELPYGRLILEDASVGDITGDGTLDLVAAWQYPPESSEGRHELGVVVYAGPLTPGDPIDGLSPDASITTSGDVGSSIYKLSGASDLDGDGVDDFVLLGEAEYEGPGRLPVVDIFLGPLSGERTSDDRDARHTWTDTLPEDVGWLEDAPRDLTGDGYPDMLLMTVDDGMGTTVDPHRTADTRDDENQTVRLFPGPLAAAPEINDEAATAIWYGPYVDQVEAPGDVDGDGSEDLVLRTWEYPPPVDEYRASFRLAPVGGASGWIDIDALTTTWGYVPIGYDGYYSYYWDEVYYRVDHSMAVGGDANGDGVLDLWLGATDLYPQGEPGSRSYGPHAWFVDDASPGGHPVESDARAYTAPIDSSEISTDSSSTAVDPVVWDAGVDATGDGVPDMLLGNEGWIKVYSALP